MPTLYRHASCTMVGSLPLSPPYEIASPLRTKPDAERKRRRRDVGIWPIVDRPIVVMRLVIRAIITVLTMVAPDMAVRAEIGGVRRAGVLRLRLRRRGSGVDRSGCGKRESAGEHECTKAFHDGILVVDPT